MNYKQLNEIFESDLPPLTYFRDVQTVRHIVHVSHAVVPIDVVLDILGHQQISLCQSHFWPWHTCVLYACSNICINATYCPCMHRNGLINITNHLIDRKAAQKVGKGHKMDDFRSIYFNHCTAPLGGQNCLTSQAICTIIFIRVRKIMSLIYS